MTPARPQPARCPCMNGADSPSTHRGAKHFDPRCPHSTLADTTGGYQRKAQALRRQAGLRGRTAPVRRVVPIILSDE